MGDIDKRKVVKDILELKEQDYIPVILNCVTISAARYGYDMMDIMTSPEKFAECCMGTREKWGADGLCGGIYMGIPMALAGHLENSHGVVAGDGEDTIHSLEDLDKLKDYNPDEDMGINHIIETVKIMRREQPNEPIYVIIATPAHNAFTLMGGKRAFKAMAKDPEFFIKVSDYLEDIVFSGVEKIIKETDIDFLWSPMPNFSGVCISRNTYEKCIWKSNKKFNKRIHDTGAKLVIHTCGPYDDRFDLVLEEYGDGWHIANTETEKVVKPYGDKVAIMGNIPSVPVLMDGTPEEVYEYSYNDCMLGVKNGSFILSGDCDLSPLTSDENIKQAVKAARDVAKELYNK